MDETRAQAYLQLIQTLLTCPKGEKQQILQANSELLDRGFLQFCEVVAKKLAEVGQENHANFLRNLARQLGQFLGMNEEGDSDNSEGENPQEYAKFIRELLQAEAESRGDIKVIYPMLAGRQHLLNLRFAEFLQQVADHLIAEHPEAIESILRDIEKLSIDINKFPRGKRANNIEIAITGYQIVLKNRQPGSEKYAGTQNNLAVAYRNRISGSRADNLERAIAFYTATLEVYTRDVFPKEWGQMQHNLGAAYRNRIRGERADNIEKAIAFYTATLSVHSREAFPEYWAMTQNNLAAAYTYRIRGEKAQNIELAIAFYTATLEVYTRDAFPKEWGQMQNNLGIAYGKRIRGERADNIERAIAFYTATLLVHTREAFPEYWAMTQNNLATAYLYRINGSRADNLELAIGFCDAALTVYTLEDFPEYWATTQNNLALAYSDRINGSRGDNLERAIEFYQACLLYTSPSPRD